MKKYTKRTNPPAEPDDYYAPQEFMDEEFWERNFRKFTVLARRRIAALPWYRVFSGRASGGLEPADYVLEAAELLMSGRRRCRKKYTREAAVAGILDSLISHHSGDVENSFAHTLLSATDRSGEQADENVVLQDRLEKFKAGFADEKQRHYIDLIAKGECDSAEDAARVLGVPVSTVRNIVKVVRRRRDQWR